MSDSSCWPREKLKEYLAGWVDENQTQQIEAHLSQCSVCEETIVALEKEPDTLVGIVSSLKQESPYDEPSELSELLAKAGDLVHAGEQGGEQADDPDGDSSSRLPAPAKIGPYILQRTLGRGGMGSVFLARHQQLGKLVAIKLLPWRSTHREHFEARFQREVRAAGGLDHPSIVSATDAGQENGTHYLVMEFIDGLDLSRLVRAMGQVSLADACELIRQVALGLSHAHAEGIVHRDIKPSNLMLNHRGQVKILDFGLARLGPWNEESAELTTVGQLMGTLDYMAPEQAERAESVDYRADLYSLGATLFRLLCGRAPLAASPVQSPLAKLRLLATEEPPKLSTLRPDAPPELTQLVAEMLARDPSHRPASAAHVAERLEPFCQSHDLSSLLRKALEKVELLQPTTASSSKAVGDVDNQDEARPSGSSPLHAAESNAKSSRSSVIHWGWIGTACAAMAGLIYCGITIWIDSQSGWLHIDSDAKVSIEIASDSAPVKRWKIEPGANTTKLYAGKYRIVLEEGSNGVQLDQEQLLVTKGGVTIAKVYKEGSPTDSRNIPPVDSTLSQQSLKNAPQTAIPPASTAALIPGDALMISSRSDSELKHKFVIQADSTAKLPMIGTVNVAGLTVDAFEKELNKRYSEWLTNPAIEVFRDSGQPTVASPDTRPIANATGTSSNPLASENASPSEPMYKGRPLSEWQKIIALEKSLEGINEALQALDASISDATRSRIVAQLKKDLPQLRWHDVYSTLSRDYVSQGLTNPYPFAFNVLRKANADKYLEYICSELQSPQDDQWKIVVLRHAMPEGVTAQELEPVKEWFMAQISQGAASPYFEDSVSCLLRLILSRESTDEDRRTWISMLEACPHLSSLFWLELPFHDYHGFESRMPKGSAGRLARVFAVGIIPESEVCWRTLIDHAIDTLKKSTNDPDELSKSGYAIVCSTAILIWSPIKPSEDQVRKLEAISKSWYEKMVESSALREIQVEVPFEVAQRIQPSFDTGTYWLPLQFALVSSLAKYSEPPESFIKTLLPGAARAINGKMKLDPWRYPPANFVLDFRPDYKAIELIEAASKARSSSQVSRDGDFADHFDLYSFSVLIDEQLAVQLFENIKPMYAAQQLKFLDKDHDGKVNVEESHDGLLKIVSYLTEGKSTEDDAKRVAEQVDTNKDKIISVDEYVAYRNAWKSKSNGATEADIAWSTKQIQKYDKDNDGKLSKEELSKMILPPKDADIDNDGYVDALEYARYRAR